MNVLHELTPAHPAWPAGLAALGAGMPARVAVRGDLAALARPALAFFCSVACPGDVILGIFDLAVALRDAGVVVAGGFHAPLERECLTVLLRGRQPVIVCPARGIGGMRVAAELRGPLAEGRLLLLAPFSDDERRVTADLARVRNRCVAALAGAVCIAHAAPGGDLLALAAEVAGWGKPLLTLPSRENAPLLALGARALPPGELAAWAARTM